MEEAEHSKAESSGSPQACFQKSFLFVAAKPAPSSFRLQDFETTWKMTFTQKKRLDTSYLRVDGWVQLTAIEKSLNQFRSRFVRARDFF